MEAAEAEVIGHGVHLVGAVHQADVGGVEVRVDGAVPQVRVFDLHLQNGVGFGRGFGHSDDLPGGVAQFGAHGAARAAANREGVDAHGAGAARRDEHAGGAGLHQIKVGVGHLDKVDGAVQPAEEGKVGHLGVNVGGGVGHFDGEDVLLFGQRFGQFKAEGRKAAAVHAHFAAVAVDGRHMVGALEFDVLAAAGGGGGQRDVVAADAAPVAAVVRAVLAVEVIPGVGQRHPNGGVAVLGEEGFFQGCDGTHGRLLCVTVF